MHGISEKKQKEEKIDYFQETYNAALVFHSVAKALAPFTGPFIKSLVSSTCLANLSTSLFGVNSSFSFPLSIFFFYFNIFSTIVFSFVLSFVFSCSFISMQ